MRNQDRPFYRNVGLMRNTTPRVKTMVSNTMESIKKAMPPRPTLPAQANPRAMIATAKSAVKKALPSMPVMKKRRKA